MIIFSDKDAISFKSRFPFDKKKLHKVSLKCYLIWTSYWKFEFSAIDEKLSTSFWKNISSVGKQQPALQGAGAHSNHIFQRHWTRKFFLKNIVVPTPTYLNFIILKCHLYSTDIRYDYGIEENRHNGTEDSNPKWFQTLEPLVEDRCTKITNYTFSVENHPPLIVKELCYCRFGFCNNGMIVHNSSITKILIVIYQLLTNFFPLI